MTGTSPNRRAAIRAAQVDDIPVIVSLIKELAAYEREPDSAKATEDDIRAAFFSESPSAFCHVAEQDGDVVGLAIWFLNYSTWTGKHGIYLEDLFVRPAARGSGLGKALLMKLVEIARERGYARVEWSVLDWNSPAIDFYRSLGARPMEEWTVWRLDGAALQ
ncbi:MAG TPA: GNAT family N-acetyltransferase [Mycobacteriales bacterium]|nr:GNAT family N-acetyltransferase [Mycobacteriales bacterium]